jgi:hypothetical protein
MKKLLLAGTILAGLGAPASATLQVAFSDGLGHIVTCADQTACDFDGTVSNLLKVQTTVGDFNIVATFAVSTFGTQDTLSFTNGFISYTTHLGDGAPAIGHLTLVAGDTSFDVPVNNISESASMTFLNNVGAGQSALRFWADGANTQPAGTTLATPGTLLDTVTGTPTLTTSSFSGDHDVGIDFFSPFSMTEGANLALISGASVTGFNETMAAGAIPEPRTWAMLLTGFGLMSLLGLKRQKIAERFAL